MDNNGTYNIVSVLNHTDEESEQLLKEAAKEFPKKATIVANGAGSEPQEVILVDTTVGVGIPGIQYFSDEGGPLEQKSLESLRSLIINNTPEAQKEVKEITQQLQDKAKADIDKEYKNLFSPEDVKARKLEEFKNIVEYHKDYLGEYLRPELAWDSKNGEYNTTKERNPIISAVAGTSFALKNTDAYRAIAETNGEEQIKRGLALNADIRLEEFKGSGYLGYRAVITRDENYKGTIGGIKRVLDGGLGVNAEKTYLYAVKGDVEEADLIDYHNKLVDLVEKKKEKLGAQEEEKVFLPTISIRSRH